jgi:hypothetical protein
MHLQIEPNPCFICDVALPEAERQIKLLTDLAARLTVDLALARQELNTLLQERQAWFTKTINGAN